MTSTKKSRLKYEEEVWAVVGKETKIVHAKFRIKMTAIHATPKIQKSKMEECEIVFEE